MILIARVQFTGKTGWARKDRVPVNMASPSNSRFQFTLPNGTVLSCNSAEDLTVAMIAIARSDDAMSVEPTAKKNRRARRGSTSASAGASAQTAPGASWTTSIVKKLLQTTTESALAMLKAAVELGPGSTAAALAQKLNTRAGALGPMIAKVSRDAQATAPHLPSPLHTEGKPGSKVLVFEPTFLDAAREVFT